MPTKNSDRKCSNLNLIGEKCANMYFLTSTGFFNKKYVFFLFWLKKRKCENDSCLELIDGYAAACGTFWQTTFTSISKFHFKSHSREVNKLILDQSLNFILKAHQRATYFASISQSYLFYLCTVGQHRWWIAF